MPDTEIAVMPDGVEKPTAVVAADDRSAAVDEEVATVGRLQARLEAVEREMLIEALRETGGNKAAAARLLGITERVMGLRVRKYGFDPKDYRTVM